MRNKYRIVTDRFAGYEIQIKYWFFPLFWFEIAGPISPMCNTFGSIESAKAYIEKRKKKTVWKSY